MEAAWGRDEGEIEGAERSAIFHRRHLSREKGKRRTLSQATSRRAPPSQRREGHDTSAVPAGEAKRE